MNNLQTTIVDDNSIANMLNALGKNYNKAIDPITFKLYASEIKTCEKEVLKIAYNICIKKHKWFPNIRELVEIKEMALKKHHHNIANDLWEQGKIDYMIYSKLHWYAGDDKFISILRAIKGQESNEKENHEYLLG